MSVIDEIAAERRRQVEQEGWSSDHDDQHSRGELALAASCYAASCADWQEGFEPDVAAPEAWPWHRSWWKPKDPRRDLIRAAALIVAEIERLDRAEKREAA